MFKDHDLRPGGPEARGGFVAGVPPAAKDPRVDGDGDHQVLKYASGRDYARGREPSVPVRSFFPLPVKLARPDVQDGLAPPRQRILA
jgi:hypothetical protein